MVSNPSSSGRQTAANSPDAEPSQPSRRDFLRGRLFRKSKSPAEEAGDEASADSPGAPAAAKAADSYLLQVSRAAMACEFQVYLNAGQAEQGTESALAALELLESLEQQLSVYRPDSEVSQLNRAASLRACRVESGLFRLLQRACELSAWTAGAFDITTGPLTKAWGFHRRQGRVPTPEAIREAMHSVGSQRMQLDPLRECVQFDRPDVEINLGALGKGYALDRVAGKLSAEGTEDYLIHAGRSSVLARGNRLSRHVDGRGWLVALQHPLRPAVRLAEIWLKDQALGTSGCGNQFFHHQGRRYSHILDPRSGWPAQGVLSATVLAPSAREADAVATALFVMGPDQATAFCQQHPEVRAILVCPGRREGSHQLLAINMDPVDWTSHTPSEYAE